jgi:hypothetical protein
MRRSPSSRSCSTCTPIKNHRVETPGGGERRRRVRQGESDRREPRIDVKALHAKIGQQALELEFLSNALRRDRGPSGKR